MRDYSNPRYWLDELGRLWHGPSAPKDNLHFAIFDGYRHTDGGEIWTLRRSDPGSRWREITNEQAEQAKQYWRAAS